MLLLYFGVFSCLIYVKLAVDMYAVLTSHTQNSGVPEAAPTMIEHNTFSRVMNSRSGLGLRVVVRHVCLL